MKYSPIIYQIVSTAAGVADLVGNRIFPVAIEQDAAMPAIAYTYKAIPADSFPGPSKVKNLQVIFYIFAPHPDDMETISVTIQEALADVAPYTSGDKIVSAVWLESQDHAQWHKDLEKFYVPLIFNFVIKDS